MPKQEARAIRSISTIAPTKKIMWTGIILVLCLLLSTGLTQIGPRPAHASSSVNIIRNGGFEQNPPLTGWGFSNCEGEANGTATVDSSRWTEGSYSAKVFTGPVTGTGCFGPEPGRTVGFTQFPQSLPSGLTFNNLTDSPNGFSFWFYLQPYGNGTMGGFEVRVFGAESTAELDYYIDLNPSFVSGAENYTDPSTGRDGLRSLLLPYYQPGQWYHFSRNLRADWGYPTPGLGGLNMSRAFLQVQFDGLATNTTEGLNSETFWLDDVRIYTGTDQPPPETHYAFFDFTDHNGKNVDNIVKWTLLDSTGQALAYTLGLNTLQPGPYFVEAYYRAYGTSTLILREQIHLDTALSLQLPMFPNSAVTGGYVTLDIAPASLNINMPDNTRMVVTIQGNAGTQYSMIADVPMKPILIQGNGLDLNQGYDWTYDPTTSTVRIGFTMPSSGENITIVFENPLRIPDLSFVDMKGSPLQSKVTFRILDSQGNIIPYVPGEILPPGNFFLEAYYGGYRIYNSSLYKVGTPPVVLEMVPLDSSQANYLAVNSTVAALSPSEFSTSVIAFNITGTGPYLVVLNVPNRPLFVERNGVHITSWVYNSTSQTIAIETGTQGAFQVVLNQPSDFTYVYLGGAVAAILAALLATFLWKRRLRLRSPRVDSKK